MNVSVFGSGSWGTALAQVLATNGHVVKIHTRRESTARSINENNKNDKYLKESILNEKISASTSLSEVLEHSNIWLVVLPSHTISEFFQSDEVRKKFKNDTKIIHASKGLDSVTFETISSIIKKQLPESCEFSPSVISGPSHAEEVIKALPTTVVVASQQREEALFFQSLFANQNFRVYTSEDVVGVELGGALKNVFGLAAGISDGLGFGDNAKAAIVTRGLEEMVRLAISIGCEEKTIRGLTGMGDLVVTANSTNSRNWKTGYLLAKGKDLETILKELGMVAEGIKATNASYLLSKQNNIQTPIIDVLYHIIFNSKDAHLSVKNLMNRIFKDEFY